MASRGKFHVAVSGGSLPKFLKGLSKREDIDWTKWWVYFCDERYVPNDDPDSNYGALKQVLLDEVRLLSCRFVDRLSCLSNIDRHIEVSGTQTSVGCSGCSLFQVMIRLFCRLHFSRS